MERSRFHMPLFTAITHKYPTAIAMLLDCGLQLTPEISSEHLLLTPEARLPGGQLSGREFVREPRPGDTESLSLLMCAASVGDALAVKLLLEAGADSSHRSDKPPDSFLVIHSQVPSLLCSCRERAHQRGGRLCIQTR